MKKRILFYLFIIVVAAISLEGGQEILPTASFAINFCNFPHAWTVSKGQGVNVGVLLPDQSETDWLKVLSTCAPAAKVTGLKEEQLFNADACPHQVILILKPPQQSQYKRFLKVLSNLKKRRVIVLMPAYFGPMRKEVNYQAWRSFLKKASALDAIIVGAHGRAFQLGNLEFWHTVPVDIHSLHVQIDGDRSSGHDSLIKRDMQNSAYLAAGAITLLKGARPTITAGKIKNMLLTRCQRITWQTIEMTDNKGSKNHWVRPFLNIESQKDFLKRCALMNPKVVGTYEGGSLDAARLLGLQPMAPGEWCSMVLGIGKAHKKASGKGVVVAILDHGFDPRNQALKNRLIKPGSVVDNAPVFSPASHGTWMARDLVKTAPGVKIMPVRICAPGRFGDPDLYIKGLEYAIANGADIISLSHRAVPKQRRGDFDDAIRKATARGITFVCIHYHGQLPEVIHPSPIEFARYDQSKDCIHVIGTNHHYPDNFPYTWGVSGTAPVVSGVVALLKEIKPRLTPSQIKEKLLNSTKRSADGYPLLDAYKAVQL